MTEALVREELERLVPVPAVAPDWDDVLRRVRGRTRRWTLLAAAAVVTLLAGAALGKVLGGFDAWLSGSPGKPASPADQARFEAANGRSWAKFPPGTQLRELIRTKAGGSTYVLFGFRSGDQLCLDLREEPSTAHARGCIPVSALASLGQPVVPVELDHGFGTIGSLPPNAPEGKYLREKAQASYGIVADGVTAVDLYSGDGLHHALVGGNAFLLVEPKPPLGNRVERVVATDVRSGRVDVPVLPAPFGTHVGNQDTGLPATGPTGVERTISNPSVGWLDRREPRGRSLAEAGVPDVLSHPGFGQIQFARVVKPDPLSNLQAVVALITSRGMPGPPGATVLCTGFLSSSTVGIGCGRRDTAFSSSPVAATLSSSGGGKQFVQLAGLAADGVARLEIFLGTGARERVPLRDNVFFAWVPRAQFPARLVGYDSAGQIVSNELFPTGF
jgi:hypothetical protein